MRFLGIGEYNDLAAMYDGLQCRGHEVRVYIEHAACQDVYRGMLCRVDDWRNQLDWIREAGKDGVVIFESALKGNEQDALRQDGFQVIGGSALGDRLEADREFGQSVLNGAGLRIANTQTFDSYDKAIAFLRDNGGRYVLKYNGADNLRTRNYIGELDDASDMIAILAVHAATHTWPPATFVLMTYIAGVEVGVGAYFNGSEFLEPACIDFEHKRFFPGELGELTGEMGTLVSYRHSHRLFAATLKPLAGMLAESAYCGYINLNLIVNDDGLWPLEFTSRFGYPGFAICEALHKEPWEAIFTRMLSKSSCQLRTRAGFAAGVVLTVPPFPYQQGYEELSKGEPICFRPGMTETDRAAIRFAEVALGANGQLVTSGMSGYIGVATGTGPSAASASRNAYRVAHQIVVPNLRYRRDIGERVVRRDYQTLRQLGWLG